MQVENRWTVKPVAAGTYGPTAAGIAWCRHLLAALVARVRRAHAIRRARAELSALDDRALRDIGIHRHEIDRVVGAWRPGADVRRAEISRYR